VKTFAKKLNVVVLLLALPVAMAKAAATDFSADVVVMGATPAGISAAVAAARSGARVILFEEKAHVGGIVAGGLTNTDIRKAGAVGGLFDEFKRRVVGHYRQTYGPESAQVRDCRGGNSFEARVAERIFSDMLAGEPGIQLHLRHRLRSASRDGARLVRVVMEDLGRSGVTVEARGRVFVDATYEGDLASLAGVPYRVGRESRDEYGERQAGRLYARFSKDERLPGSTGEADAGIQAYCFRFHLSRQPENRVPVEKPDGYHRDDYRHLLADIKAGKVARLRDAIQLYKMPNDKYEANSDHPHPDTGVPSESLDLAGDNWSWPEASWQERERIFRRYWSYNEGLMWFLQQDPEVPEAIRAEAREWGFPKDEFTDNRHRPWQLYVRQGRRIRGEYTFTQRDADPDPATGKPRRQADAIAVAEYPFDSHAVHKFDPAHPGVREGYFYVDHAPLQLPYRILVPQRVDGLLVPVACSASHVGYQTIRMEPVFMALGEAAGIAAELAIQWGVELRAVPVKALQDEIVRRGGVILYEE
jgi:FAD dependent oxidoreductase